MLRAANPIVRRPGGENADGVPKTDAEGTEKEK
jgi:hypothetical protein